MSSESSAFAALFVRALAEAGVEHAVASPGSRSTPLVLAFDAEPRITLHMLTDERAAAFFALGQAKRSARPSIVLSTSGSAGAHFYPAVLEAERALLPLIVLTADRPWELANTHANQTLDQRALFGSHVRACLELGEPDARALPWVPHVALSAVLHALRPTGGPVHVNARFRKPLEPGADDVGAPLALGIPRLHLPRPASPAVPEALHQAVARARRGVVVAGPRLGAADRDRALAAAVARFVGESGFCLLAETTSGIAYGPECGELALPAFDLWLEAALDAGELPDFVLQLGAPPVSSAWERCASRLAGIPRWHVAPAGLPDPTASASDFLLADPEALLALLPGHGERDLEFAERWRSRAHRLERALDDVHGEPSIGRALLRSLPAGAVLLVGNSLPVRDLDWFAARSSVPVEVLHQRGLSGIEGFVAGAAGARSVLSPERPLYALIGDVALRHDLGSLALLSSVVGPLTLVVVNNGGGRIFDELPVARRIEEGRLARLFRTPEDVDLASFARAVGVDYQRIESPEGLLELEPAPMARARIVEVRVAGGEGAELRKRVRALAHRAEAR